ncbi:MAG: hypothetical protein AB8B73_12625 [Ekhidna sp.]
MIIQFENFQISLNEILDANFSLSNFHGSELNALKLISEWFSDQDTFTFKTSGSTGKSKEILIHRKMIEYSTMATFDRIDPERKLNSSLLCLDPQFIGGAMVIFRALIMEHNITVIEPSKSPLEALETDSQFGLASMVPLQYLNSPADRINQIDTIIIGGSPIGIKSNSDIKSNVFSSYGMTETVSHIALRKIDETDFVTTGDTKVSLGKDSSLHISGTITNEEILETNDIVELKSDISFKWIGRKDFVINSGGIKINPETLEQKLSSQIQSEFIVSSQKDDFLGQKIILVVEGIEKESFDFSLLTKYEVPKNVLFVAEIPKTASGKIDRMQTEKMISNIEFE